MKRVPLEICNKQNGKNLLGEFEFMIHNNPWASLHLDGHKSRLNRRNKRISASYIFGHTINDEITTNVPQSVAEFFNE